MSDSIYCTVDGVSLVHCLVYHIDIIKDNDDGTTSMSNTTSDCSILTVITLQLSGMDEPLVVYIVNKIWPN